MDGTGDEHAARSPLPVLREHVVSCLHERVAREPALGIVFLRRLIVYRRWRERVGRGVKFKGGPTPIAAVREPLAVPHHEIDVMLGSRYGRFWKELVLFR